jgi:hypothetical protein
LATSPDGLLLVVSHLFAVPVLWGGWKKLVTNENLDARNEILEAARGRGGGWRKSTFVHSNMLQLYIIINLLDLRVRSLHWLYLPANERD